MKWNLARCFIDAALQDLLARSSCERLVETTPIFEERPRMGTEVQHTELNTYQTPCNDWYESDLSSQQARSSIIYLLGLGHG